MPCVTRQIRAVFTTLRWHCHSACRTSSAQLLKASSTVFEVGRGPITPTPASPCGSTAIHRGSQRVQSINQSIVNFQSGLSIENTARSTICVCKPDEPNARIWLSEQKRLESSAEGCQRRCRRNLRWQAVPNLMRASNRTCSAADSGTVNRRLDEAVAAGRAKSSAT